MAKLRMAHANTHGARKPPGPKEINARKPTSIYFSREKIHFTELPKRSIMIPYIPNPLQHKGELHILYFILRIKLSENSNRS